MNLVAVLRYGAKCAIALPYFSQINEHTLRGGDIVLPDE
jgi:hypothetical protein